MTRPNLSPKAPSDPERSRTGTPRGPGTKKKNRPGGLRCDEDIDQLLAAQECHRFDWKKIAAAACESGDAEAKEVFHRNLYTMCRAFLNGPSQLLQEETRERLRTARRNMVLAWEESERERYRAILNKAPAEPKRFVAWVMDTINRHPSGGNHHLLRKLSSDARLDQLREFVYQETPYNMYFADVLLLLMPGIYGSIRMEIAKNLWDEMGNGIASEVHRTTRLRLMKALDIPTEAHCIDQGRLVWEELALVNLYFACALEQQAPAQLVGVLLMTEVTEPARVKPQLEGLRRFGIDENALRFLAVHAEVDVEHADGWLNEVVLPMVNKDQSLCKEVALGVLRGLDALQDVSDRMVTHLGFAETSSA